MINNQCQFLGRLGQDINIKTFDSGDKIGNVSIAVDDSYKNKQGEKVERTRWVNLVFRNRLAEVVEQYAPKGTQIIVQAKYAPREYEVEGEKRYSHEFMVLSMQLIDSRSDAKPQEKTTKQEKIEASAAVQDVNNIGDDDDDDLPF